MVATFLRPDTSCSNNPQSQRLGLKALNPLEPLHTPHSVLCLRFPCITSDVLFFCTGRWTHQVPGSSFWLISGHPLKCQGGVSPQQGWGPSVCSYKGNCGFFLFSFSLSSSFFLDMGKGALCLNWVFVALYYRESQKMFYVNDYVPWLEPQ